MPIRLSRIALAATVVLLAGVVAIVAVVLVLRSSPRASPEWAEFGLGPPSDRGARIEPGGVRAVGITLLQAIGIAYDMPAVRVIGPPWLAQTRYSLTAVRGAEAPDAVAPLLRAELQQRLDLATHVEERPFDVFILTVDDETRLTRAKSNLAQVWIRDDSSSIHGADGRMIAAALQNILAKPVINETGLTDSYDIEVAWTADRVPSVTSALKEVGLRLVPAQRPLPALIVDRVQRDPALVLLSGVGHLLRYMPRGVRRHVSDVFTIR